MFVLGIIFRWWVISAVPQGLVMDQEEYHHIALDMLGEKEYMYTSAYRLPGYPMLLAIMYKVFGKGNFLSVKVMQVMFDTLTAVFVFFLAKNLYGTQTPAWIAYILYLFNPWTAAYTGVALTEVTAVFLLALIFLLLMLFLKNQKIMYAVSLSFLLAYLPQVRPGFLYFSIIVFGLLLYQIFKRYRVKARKWLAIVVMIYIFAAPFAYNMLRNRIYFGQASPMTVDNVLVKEFYISLFIENADTIPFIPAQVTWIHNEFSTGNNREERQKIAKKYLKLSVEEIGKDPYKFFLTRLKKTISVWGKHNLYPYATLKNKQITKFTYQANNILLAISLFGLAHFIWRGKHIRSDKGARWIGGLTVFLAVYMSVIHAFTLTAERFSLPAYPLLFLFAGYFIWIFTRGLVKK